MTPDRTDRRGAAFFDRDGTLIVDHGYTFRPEDLVWQPGAIDAIRACNAAGLLVIVVTNQSGVARGYFGVDDVAVFHAAMSVALDGEGARIDAFYHCPYHGDGTVLRYCVADHPERKPNPGMLRRAMLEMPVDSARSFMVGDTDADLGAAAALGLPARKVAPGDLLSAVTALIVETAVRYGDDPLAALRERQSRARAWLFDSALPLWWEHGFDRTTRQFHERLDTDATPVDLPRRVRVQARQTAVFALAGRLGWQGPWREAVESGVRTLLDTGLRPDGGSHHLLDVCGHVADARRDLYDLAFIIYALAEAAQALGERADLIVAARAQLAWLNANWRHPLGGFHEGDVAPAPPRRQNPHMHLFEAILALHDASGAAEDLLVAHEIAGLVRDRLYDPAHGMIAELFAEDWSRLPGPEGAICEPGHQFEWSWLLQRYGGLTGEDWSTLAETLRVNGEVFGVTPSTGFILDEINADGSPRTRTSRLWPHTERIKANVARFRHAGERAAADAAVHAYDALMRYCEGLRPGLWRDRQTAEGVYASEPSPASSFYHVIVALRELIEAPVGPA